MNELIAIIKRGANFVWKNPQIVLTLSLIVIIPLAFLFTSERFLGVARENQDKLERGRIGLLQDAVAVFVPDLIATPEKITEKLMQMRSLNETITSFEVLTKNESGEYVVVASINPETIGKIKTLDEATTFQFGAAGADPSVSFAQEIFVDGDRYWHAVRAVKSGQRIIAYLTTDISMVQADYISSRGITEAYLVLLLVVACVLVLLVRHARIVDYTTLYRRLKEVDQMKDDFVSMAAHELRSPLTIIRGYVDMLGEGEGLSDAGKQHLHRIDESAKRLNELVGDILDVSKIQEGRLSFHMQSFDPVPIVEDVVRGFMQPAKEKLLELHLENGPHQLILADPDRFRQVAVNLIGNAIKYTPKGEVRVSTGAEKGNFFFRVADTGLGISAENQKHLFEKFYRVKNETTAEIQGTGLGLWITEQIIREMKGSIALESIEGKGSVFIVRFPISV